VSDATRLESSTFAVHGERAELLLGDGTVTITKQVPTQAEPIEVCVPIDRIRGASVERPSRGQPGWLHLAVVGGTSEPPTDLAAATDPHTVLVTSKNLTAARRFAKLVTDHIRRRGMPPELPEAGHSTSVTLTAAPDPAPTSAPTTPPPPVPPPMPPSDGPTPPAPPSDPSPSLPATDGTASSTEPADGEVADAAAIVGQLRELAELHESGALTDEEFERAKGRILER
jgi:hypothetical protein